MHGFFTISHSSNWVLAEKECGRYLMALFLQSIMGFLQLEGHSEEVQYLI